MAQITKLIDDLDGSEDSVETVRFALAGKAYELDLSAANRQALEAALAPFIAAARTPGSAYAKVVGNATIQAGGQPLRAEELIAATAVGESLLQRLERVAVEHQAEVVEVGAVGVGGEQVDDGGRRDAHRREQGLAASPLVDALGLEAELPAVELDRCLDVAALEHDVVEAGDAEAHGWKLCVSVSGSSESGVIGLRPPST